MIIPLSDEYRIRGTKHCWQLEKVVKRKGQPEWQPRSYHSTFGDAVGAACRREIRLHPANSLADAIRAVDKIVAKYARVFDEALESANSKRAA